MRIGIDLDNTIICYEGLFYQLAIENKWIPETCSPDKTSIRNHLKTEGRNDLWTQLQSLVYGTHLSEAKPYSGANDFIEKFLKKGNSIEIYSHKTEYPLAGERLNLHHAAMDWLQANGVVGTSPYSLHPDHVHFFPTRTSKVEAIAKNNLDLFIDDLPEVFEENGFPEKVIKVLFSPEQSYPSETYNFSAKSWNEINRYCEDAVISHAH
jgi:hypothetical protein